MYGQKIEILKVQPSHDSPANKISTCVKGKFSWGHINSDQRLTKPLVRKMVNFMRLNGKKPSML